MRFPEFEGEWETLKIGDILKIGSGRDYKHLLSGNIPVFGTGGQMTAVSSFLYDGESVFIGRKGTINKPSYFNGKFWTVDTLFYTHSFENALPKFVLYLFENINWLNFNEASGVPSLSKSTIEKIEINIPSIKEQEKICKTLSLIDAHIQTQSKIIEELKSLKKIISKNIFSQKLKLNPKSEFPTWKIKKLEEVCVIIGGGTPETSKPEYWNGDVQWFTPTEIKQNFVNRSERTITKLGLKNSSAKILPKGTILLTTRATIGEVAIAENECTTNQGFQSLITKEGFDNYFLFSWIKQNKSELLKRANGSTFPEISKSEIEKILINIPEYSEQTKIGDLFFKIDVKIDIEEKLSKKLELQKQYLLSNLFI